MGNREVGSFLEQRNIQQLLKDYIAIITKPAKLLNGNGSYTYNSDPSAVDDRIRALKLFMTSPGSSEIDAKWGGTIYSEIWAYILTTVAYPQVFSTAGNLRVRLVPTDLDETKDYKRDENISPFDHQKGADLLMFEERADGDYPLLLVDVTLGNSSTLKHKRDRLLLQARTETPVVILGLRDLRVFPSKTDTVGGFPKFLFQSCDDIKAGSNATVVLEKYTDPKWTLDLKERMLAGIDLTERKLMISASPYSDKVEVALGKLRRVRGVLV